MHCNTSVTERTGIEETRVDSSAKLVEEAKRILHKTQSTEGRPERGTAAKSWHSLQPAAEMYISPHQPIHISSSASGSSWQKLRHDCRVNQPRNHAARCVSSARESKAWTHPCGLARARHERVLHAAVGGRHHHARLVLRAAGRTTRQSVTLALTQRAVLKRKGEEPLGDTHYPEPTASYSGIWPQHAPPARSAKERASGLSSACADGLRSFRNLEPSFSSSCMQQRDRNPTRTRSAHCSPNCSHAGHNGITSATDNPHSTVQLRARLKQNRACLLEFLFVAQHNLAHAAPLQIHLDALLTGGTRSNRGETSINQNEFTQTLNVGAVASLASRVGCCCVTPVVAAAAAAQTADGWALGPSLATMGVGPRFLSESSSTPERTKSASADEHHTHASTRVLWRTEKLLADPALDQPGIDVAGWHPGALCTATASRRGAMCSQGDS